MTEAILPGVLIEVRPEGLITPGAVTVGNMGVVGTASKGPINSPVVLGDYAAAVATFGTYDNWVDGASNELSLVRALELAYSQGASTVFAVRVASGAAAASFTLTSPSGDCVTVRGKTQGTWANAVTVEVTTADTTALVDDETVAGAPPAGPLAHTPIVKSALTRIQLTPSGGGAAQDLGIRYDGDPGVTAAGQVEIDRATGALTFGTAPAAGDVVKARYMVDSTSAAKVIVKGEGIEETYSVVSGDDLVNDIKASSTLLAATAEANAGELPDALAQSNLSGGNNGASGANFQNGLNKLLDVDAHIIVAAGQDTSFGDELAAHCLQASSDEVKRERIAVVGSALNPALGDLTGHSLNSDRLIFVAPGIKVNDNSQSPPVEVTLPGAYAAAAVAGRIAGSDSHVSPTNKVLQVGGLENEYSRAELKQLVQARLLALESRQGTRIVKGITTSSNTAWHQITTRRIVDEAKFGVRSAASPYIGLLNNERVRGAMRATINSFLAGMVLDEKLISYELDVTATRDEEIRGIARVTMVLRPTFSIDFIKVTMFLE